MIPLEIAQLHLSLIQDVKWVVEGLMAAGGLVGCYLISRFGWVK